MAVIDRILAVIGKDSQNIEMSATGNSIVPYDLEVQNQLTFNGGTNFLNSAKLETLIDGLQDASSLHHHDGRYVDFNSSQILTNKTINADSGNVITNLTNSAIKAAAGINLNKLEALVNTSRALVSNGSGFISTSATTAAELAQLSGRSIGGNAAGDILTIDDVQTISGQKIFNNTKLAVGDIDGSHAFVFSTNSNLTGNINVNFPTDLTTSDYFVFNDTTQTLTNKTLTSPKINSATPLTASSDQLNSVDTTGSLTSQLAAKLDKATLTTDGDIYVRVGGSVTRLGIGGSGTVLSSNGTTVSWQPAGAGDVTAASSLTDNALVTGDGGLKGIKTESGSGFVKTTSGVPAYQASISLTADVSGTLPIANGGTGATAASGTGNVVLENAPTFLGTVTFTGLADFTDIDISGDIAIGASSVVVTSSLTDVIEISNSATDATEKRGAIGTLHHDSGTKTLPVMALMVQAAASSNIVNIGGGDVNSYAATEIRFFTSTTTDDTTHDRAATIDSNGNFGIGTSTVLAKLHVQDGTSSGVTPNSIGDMAVFETGDVGDKGISIITDSSSTASILFGKSGQNNSGLIQYDHSNDIMSFGVAANTDLVTIDSTGQVDIAGAAVITDDLTVGTDGLKFDVSTKRLGIGISAPTDEIHLKGDDYRVLIEDSAGNDSMWFGDSLSGGGGFMFLYDGGTLTTGIRSYGATFFNSGGDFEVNTDDLFVDASTNRVGIGTDAPTTTLDVNGTMSYAVSNVETSTSTTLDATNQTIFRQITNSRTVSTITGVTGQVIHIAASGVSVTLNNSGNIALKTATLVIGSNGGATLVRDASSKWRVVGYY